MDHAIQAIENRPTLAPTRRATAVSTTQRSAKLQNLRNVKTWKACGVAAGLRGYVIHI